MKVVGLCLLNILIEQFDLWTDLNLADSKWVCTHTHLPVHTAVYSRLMSAFVLHVLPRLCIEEYLRTYFCSFQAVIHFCIKELLRSLRTVIQLSFRPCAASGLSHSYLNPTSVSLSCLVSMLRSTSASTSVVCRPSLSSLISALRSTSAVCGLSFLSCLALDDTYSDRLSLVSSLCVEEYLHKYFRSLRAFVLVLPYIEWAVSLVSGPCIGASFICCPYIEDYLCKYLCCLLAHFFLPCVERAVSLIPCVDEYKLQG